ncbi:MAG: isochorismatase family protein [Deltaproteobacteria bacterium]|nr:isochorismatase family protein [Deltaproteobacteria bacterium]
MKSKRPWDGIISDEEQRAYQAAGFGKASGIGARPVLLIIDIQYRTVGTTPKPFWESIREFPTSCGEVGWAAVKKIAPLLTAVRGKGFPVMYPYVAPKQAYDAGRLADKVPSIMTIPEKGYEFVKEIAPQEGDILIPKRHPSAFFATPLLSYLIDRKVDTIFITGCTTSGCVRGTVVDSFSYNFRVVVPEECVYDRSSTSHAVNLFDMASKYADVMPVAEAVRLLEKLPPGGA